MRTAGKDERGRTGGSREVAVRYAAMDGSLGGRVAQSVEAVLAAARDAGLDGVELSIRADYAQDRLWSLDGACSAAAAARALRLDLPSLALLMLNEGSFAGNDDTRARAHAVVRHGLIVARELGARILLLPFFGVARIDGAAAVGRVIEDLRALAPEAEAAGVALAIETTLPAPEVIGILRAVGSRAVTNYFDVANAVWLGYEPVAEIEVLHAAGALPQIHIKDVREKPADRPPGDGRVPYPLVMSTLRRLGYDGYFVFETAPTDDPVAATRRHRAFVADLLTAP